MTPTYPQWSVSYIQGVHKTTMEMFNKRAEVKWYEIGVFDEEWLAVPFVTKYKIIQLDYLDHVEFDVYVSSKDVGRIEYICSMSKLRGDPTRQTMVASKICSRFK